jgi:hypothetical protein
MTTTQIEKFLEKNYIDKAPVKLNFRTRRPIIGMFITSADYNELKVKNFWRIVGESNLDSYRKSKDTNLARIFSGADITRLSIP